MVIHPAIRPRIRYFMVNTPFVSAHSKHSYMGFTMPLLVLAGHAPGIYAQTQVIESALTKREFFAPRRDRASARSGRGGERKREVAN